jgi:Bacterial Ig domain/Cellulose binding domain
MKLMHQSVGARRWLPILAAALVCGLSAEPAHSHSSKSHATKSHKSHVSKRRNHHYTHNHWHHIHKPRHCHKPPPPPPPAPGNPQDGRCGYAIGTGTQSINGKSFQAWVDVKNAGGPIGTSFEVLLDVGNSRVLDTSKASFTLTNDGYLVESPNLKNQKIKVGSSYRFGFTGQSPYQGHSAQVLSVNGVKCDTAGPTVELGVLPGFVTEASTLTLTATASDNIGVRKVVFQRDGQAIGEDRTAPYSLDVALTEASNGRHTFAAVAYDRSGNQVSDSDSTLIAIDNRFLGTAVAAPVDYEDALSYFDQITPGNAGKWGSVEAQRDVMNWDDLDEAYYFTPWYGANNNPHGWKACLPPSSSKSSRSGWQPLQTGIQTCHSSTS